VRLNRLIPSLLVVSISPAQAHSVFGETASFWAGAAHVAVSPVALAILIALSARLATQTPRAAYTGIATLVLSSGVAAATATVPILGPLAAAVIGGIAALSPRHIRHESVPLGLFAGVALGAAIALDARTVVACLGVAVASGYLTMLAYEGLERLEHISSIPRRLFGSWTAALGLLLVALGLRG
jgi:hydrogenase/urease accessory protein HupE